MVRFLIAKQTLYYKVSNDKFLMIKKIHCQSEYTNKVILKEVKLSTPKLCFSNIYSVF